MKQIIIDQNGHTVLRNYTDTVVNLRREVAATLAETSSVVAWSIAWLKYPDDPVESRCSASISSRGAQLWVVELPIIRFLTGIRSHDGVVTLNFESDETVELFWVPPASMRLVMVIDIYPDRNAWWADKSYLMAFDHANRAYRLPVANVFDDGALCTGDYHRTAGTSLEVVQISFNQFKSSGWNADLYATKKDEFKIKTEKLMRWRATDSGFVQLTDDDAAWTSLCYRIAGDITNRAVEVLDTPPAVDSPPDEEEDEEGGEDEQDA